VRNGKLTTIDLAEVLERMSALAGKIAAFGSAGSAR